MSRLLLCCLCIAVGAQCQDSISLAVDPINQIVPLGAQAVFTIDISGLGNGTALGVYDVTLGFDSTLLSYNNAVFGSQLDLFGLGDIQSVTTGTGTVELFELSLESISDLNTLQATAFTLATITFDTIASGRNSPATLSINALGDASGNSIDVAVQNASISVTPLSDTPEPATALLLLSTSFAWMVLRKHWCTRPQ